MSTATFNSICFTRGCLWKDEGKSSTGVKKNNRVKLYARGSATLSTKSLQVEDGKPQKSEKQVRIRLLGASGYTGAKIIRLLVNHPYFGATLMTADRKVGRSIGSVFPHLITQE